MQHLFCISLHRQILSLGISTFQWSLRRKGITNSGEVLTCYLVKLELLSEAGCIHIQGAGCDSSKDAEGFHPCNYKAYVYHW